MSDNPIKQQKRGHRTVLVIDFFYLDKTGRRCRYRKDASFQDDPRAARDEARRLQHMAVRNGTLATRPPAPTFSKFFSETYRTVVYPRLRPATRVRYDALVRQTVGTFFGTTSLSSIESGLMPRFEGMLAKRGVTARGPVNLVRSVLRSAFELGFIDEMPSLPPARAQGESWHGLQPVPRLRPRRARLRGGCGLRCCSPLSVACGLAKCAPSRPATLI